MSKVPKKVIGITGNICAGKSEVTKYLKEKGYKIIDGDLITNQIYNDDLAFKQAMINLFGPSIIKEDKIDKTKVAQLVFADKNQLNNLNQLIQPYIIKRMSEAINRLDGLFFIDGALIFEMGLDKQCDRMIYLSTTKDLQLKRLQTRNKLSEAQALQRIEAQTKLSKDNPLIDYWIDNSYGKEHLFQELDKILEIEG